MGQRGDVDLDHLQLALELRVRELPEESEPGVVDQHFDRNVLVVEEVKDRLRSIGSPQIGGEDLDPDAELSLDLTRCRLERIALAGHQHEIESIAGENFRDLDSYPAGAASDKGGLVLGAVSFWAHGLKLAIPCYGWITLSEHRCSSVDSSAPSC